MGDYQHQTILVRACDGQEDLRKAHAYAVSLFTSRHVTDIAHVINGWSFFTINPSGGKLGGGIESDAVMLREIWREKVALDHFNISYLDVSWGEWGDAFTHDGIGLMRSKQRTR